MSYFPSAIKRSSRNTPCVYVCILLILRLCRQKKRSSQKGILNSQNVFLYIYSDTIRVYTNINDIFSSVNSAEISYLYQLPQTFSAAQRLRKKCDGVNASAHLKKNIAYSKLTSFFKIYYFYCVQRSRFHEK